MTARGPVRRVVGDIRGAARFTTYAVRPSYLGWTGQGNLGDQSILEAQQVYFGTSFHVLPPVDMKVVLGRARRLGSRRPSTRLLLGGGTLVGRPEWLARVEDHREVAGGQRLTVWGAGVEDPDFRSDRQFTSTDDLQAWAARLRDADAIGVRGPRSVEILARFGVTARVVGDPALRLTADAPLPTVAGRVLVNLARPEATYTDLAGDVLLSVGEACRQLAACGNSVLLFGMHDSDLDAIGKVKALVPGVGVVGVPQDVQDLLSLISSADVVISQRLHGNVLAAAIGVPFVSLDYRPKCRDFAASVGMEDTNLQLSAVTAGALVDAVRHAREGLDLAAYRRRVDDLRAIPAPAGFR